MSKDIAKQESITIYGESGIWSDAYCYTCPYREYQCKLSCNEDRKRAAAQEYIDGAMKQESKKYCYGCDYRANNSCDHVCDQVRQQVIEEVRQAYINGGRTKYLYDTNGNEYYTTRDGMRHYTRDEG